MKLHLCVVVIAWYIPSISAGTGGFWHISDMHYDPQEMAKRSCTKGQDTIPSWGSDFCGSKLKLIKSSLAAMKEILPNPDFILWTGDSVLHYLNGNLGTEDEVIEIMLNLSIAIDDAFPDTLVIASLGNHDYVPDNQLPANFSRIYISVWEKWKQLGWFNFEIGEKDSFNKYGFYATKIKPGLVAVAMNTNFYYLNNKVYASLPADPGNQLQVLDNLLQMAALNSTKVLISAHVPFGVGDRGEYRHMYSFYNEKFIDIITKHHKVIVGSFFGHEHDDSFKIIFDENRTPVSVAYLAPSITPWRWISPAKVEAPFHNPAVNLFQYNNETFELEDKIGYYFDLKTANAGRSTHWKELYRFKSQFGIEDMTPQSVLKAAERIMKGDKFANYIQAYYCRPDISDFVCDNLCRHGMSCAIFETKHSKAEMCVKEYYNNGRASIHNLQLLLLLMVMPLLLKP